MTDLSTRQEPSADLAPLQGHPPPLPTRLGWTARLPLVVRVLSHLLIWTSVLVPAVLVLARGWTAIGDLAAISVRADQTFSAHAPLVGMYSTAATGLGHIVFDPGPLPFWLLSVPVHLDRAHGLVWGAALWWGLALSLAVEALYRSRLWVGGAVVALVAADLLWAAPWVPDDPAWNAYFPLPFLIASIALAIVVGTGRLTWWPVLVGTASVAAQSHLLMTAPSVALIVVSPIVGFLVAGRPKKLGWLLAGVVVAALCWLAPVAQNFGSHGNLAALARGTRGTHILGLGFGLRTLAAAGDPFPIWLRREPLSFFLDIGFVFNRQPAWGVVLLVLLALVAVLTFVTRKKALGVTAVVGFVTALSLVVSFALIPVSNLPIIDYLMIVLWIEGVMLWTVLVWAVGTAGISLLGAWRRRRSAAAPATGHGAGASGGPRPWANQPRLALAAATCALVGGFGAVGALAVTTDLSSTANFGTNWTPAEAAEVHDIAVSVQHMVAKGPVNIEVVGPASDPVPTIAVSEGAGWQLMIDGWQPGVLGIEPAFSGLPPLRGATTILVRVRGGMADGAFESAKVEQAAAGRH